MVHIGVVDLVRRGLAGAIERLDHDGAVVGLALLLRILGRLRNPGLPDPWGSPAR